MPLIDRQEIRRQIGLENGWLIEGTLTADGAADGSTILDTNLYSDARDQYVRNRDIIAITSGVRRGDRRPTTGGLGSDGILVASPIFGAQIVSGVSYEIWDADGPHPDDIDRNIDLALREFCWYWNLVPLTLIRGGDLEDRGLAISGGNVVDSLDANAIVFTATNATPTIVDLDPPDEIARRAYNILATAANGFIASQVIDVDPAKPNYYLSALVSGRDSGGNAGSAVRLVLFDVTNSVAFTLDADPLEHVRRGWGLLRSAFTLPATCSQFQLRLQVVTNGDTGRFTAIQLLNENRTNISLPRRVAGKRFVGSVIERTGDTFGEFSKREWRGQLERREVQGRGVSLNLIPAPEQKALYYYERTGFPGLTANPSLITDDDNTTWAAEEWIKVATLVKLYQFMSSRDRVEAPTRWTAILNEAIELLGVLQDDFGAEDMFVEDSPVRSYNAIRRV